MPPKRPPPILLTRSPSSNLRHEISLKRDEILGYIKRREYMDDLHKKINAKIDSVAKITCTFIRPVMKPEFVCIAIKNIVIVDKNEEKPIKINTIFFHDRRNNKWYPLASIWIKQPVDILGHIEERFSNLSKIAETEGLDYFSEHLDVKRFLEYGIFGTEENALCSELLEKHSEDIIELAEEEDKVAIFTMVDLDILDVNELERTPDGFFANYNSQCVTFNIHADTHRKRHKAVSMKTRPAENMQHTIDDLLSARFEGLRLPRQSQKSKSSRRFNSSRKARPVLPPKSSKKARQMARKKIVSKKANATAAAKPDNKSN